MKIIVSHDVDHLYAREHYLDMILPKHIIRSKFEFLRGYISFSEFKSRFGELISGRLHRINELTEYDKAQQIPSTFFIGVNKGLGLSYSIEDASSAINFIQSKGFDIGIHGIAYNDPLAIAQERLKFAKIAGHEDFGIRMHYLRQSADTLKYLSEAGYLFDCSVAKFCPTYKAGNLTEFPVHIMDGWIINHGKSWQSVNTEKALDNSKRLVESGLKEGIDYFSILFHDRYFSGCFVTWRDWYTLFIEWLKSNKFEFTSYKAALKAME
ncbi:MAG: hypothetical protein BWY70_00012 [Bacteroidetes bacterium ADurb.Bin408]|nr:MAG: hypothetical protein BWY70_00012 [Bacteroidetes bacterium ADurb.Bin408]